jgi:hypothetical protein
LNSPKRGRVLILAHRVNEHDLSGHALRQGGWRHLKLALIAPRTKRYTLENGKVWERRKGELLLPDEFTRHIIERLRASKSPGFETLQQQNPGACEQLRIKAEYFSTFPMSAIPATGSGVVLSVDPGQKGGANHSFSVVQAWLPQGGVHRLLDQWMARASDFPRCSRCG